MNFFPFRAREKIQRISMKVKDAKIPFTFSTVSIQKILSPARWLIQWTELVDLAWFIGESPSEVPLMAQENSSGKILG